MLRVMQHTFILLSILLLISISTPETAGAASKGDATIQGLVEDIKYDVEKLRGLEYQRDIDSKLISSQELMDFIRAEVEEQVPPEKERAINLVYGQLGLIPTGNGFIETFEKLMEEQAGGVYDADNNELLIVAANLPGLTEEGDVSGGIMGMLGIDPMMLLRIVLAHELCHALEDQHFGFNDTFKEILELSSSDKEFALQCLVEGTATRLMMDYATGGVPITAFQRKLNRMLTGMMTELTVKAPTYFKRTLTAPYTFGEAFVSYLLTSEQDWTAINAAYADYPTSMEQVIHPEKYLVERDYPSEVRLADFAGAMGEGYEELMQDTLGEFLIDILLDVELTREEFDAAPGGWDGDRLAGIIGPDDEVTIVWHSVWDAPPDAGEFANALILFLRARDGDFTDAAFDSYKNSEVATFHDANSRVCMIARTWDEVIFIDNAPGGMAGSLYDAALAGDVVERK